MNNTYTLEICTNNSKLKELYSKRANYSTDSGVDLYFPSQTIFRPLETTTVDMGISCKMTDPIGNPCGFYLYPRSSISKTPLVLANSVGIVDAEYRGPIMLALRNIPNRYMRCCIDKDEYPSSIAPYEIDYIAEEGHRLAQICSPTLSPIRVVLVNSLDNTDRGSGGFGSTGL